ncbi:unnamed protein product [Sphenostylis stenocarpa]|uniref:Uncharacterized protein n=1 Tax=Sphenostylis stenocarpa TaxID=92480 RepID=A0AA86RUE4_9FABA|nr:unnamed protein product [Sphenostylis stenocarpa]
MNKKERLSSVSAGDKNGEVVKIDHEEAMKRRDQFLHIFLIKSKIVYFSTSASLSVMTDLLGIFRLSVEFCIFKKKGYLSIVTYQTSFHFE